MAGLKDSQHLTLSLKEIQVATNNFETCIGNGGYGRVYKGELFIAGKHTMVAVKRLHENLGQGLKEFLTEIQLLTGQEHPNVVSLLGFCDEGKEKIIVYEYAEHGGLDRYIRPCDTTYCLTWLERLKICVDVARGLDHLHNHVGKHQSIIHRDIKSSNILLDGNWVAKVSDLGLSKLSLSGLDRSEVITHACGTPGYWEPEYIISGILTKKSDVFSFGMVLFEVIFGRLCTVKGDDGLFLSAKLAKYCYQNNTLDDIIHPKLRSQMSTYSIHQLSEIAYGCLEDDREQRPPMDVVKKELEEMLKIEMYQSGYQLAIEAAPRDIHPIAILGHQVAEFMEINSIEEEPINTQSSCESTTLAVQAIGVPDLQGDELEEAIDNFENKPKIKGGLFRKGYLGVLRGGQTTGIKMLCLPPFGGYGLRETPGCLKTILSRLSTRFLKSKRFLDQF